MTALFSGARQIVRVVPYDIFTGNNLTAGLMVLKDHCLLGLGLMLAAGEVPRIAGAFGLDTSTRANMMSAVYTAQAAVNTTRTVVQAVAPKIIQREEFAYEANLCCIPFMPGISKKIRSLQRMRAGSLWNKDTLFFVPIYFTPIF